MRFGVKAAPADVHAIAQLEGAQFLETVLTGEDLQDRYEQTRSAFMGQEVLVVHAPFRVPGGAEVDVADPDPAHREKSLRMWRLSVRLAQDLGARWVVLHPGGIVSQEVAEAEDAGEKRALAIERTTQALVALEDEGARDRVLMENMPAHYHRADGRTHRMLTGQGIMDFYGWLDHTAGICLDVSHAVLTPGTTRTLRTFLGRGASWIKHVHLGDAMPPDGEGLPMGSGVVPWDEVAAGLKAVEEVAGGLSAVPEVRGGHEQEGAGFREALRFAREKL